MNYLLDTNILIDWYTQGPGQKFISNLIEKEKNLQLGTSWISVIEFLVKATLKEEQTLLGLFEAGDLTLYEINGLEVTLKVSQARRETGLAIPDCIILTTAEAHQAILVTRDQELGKRGKKIWGDIILLSS